MKTRILLLVAFTVSLTFVPGCRKVAQPGAKVIGVSLLNRGHLFYKDLEDGLKEQAAKYGYELIVTSADFDLGKQISQIEDFTSRKVDAIIVCPVDSKGVGPGVEKAAAAKIPVFTADIAAENAPVVCHIASDNAAGGRLAGEFLARYLNGTGNIAIINQPVVTSVLDRVEGFRAALARFPGMKIVADVNGQGVRDRALQATADVLQAHPDLQGIFGINDDSALGALDACEQFKRTGIAIVGYDATPPAADAIRRGSLLKADVIQYPKKIGAATIEMIHTHFAGGQVPKIFPVEVGLVDQTNVR